MRRGLNVWTGLGWLVGSRTARERGLLLLQCPRLVLRQPAPGGTRGGDSQLAGVYFCGRLGE